MSNMLIDAPLLSCPCPIDRSQQDFQEEFLKYLARLADLSTLRTTLPSVRFWRDEDLAYVLHERQCYPFRHTLAQAFSACYEEGEFQLEDANMLATALLEKSLRLEDYSDVADIVIKSYEIIDDPVENRADIYAEHLCKLVSIALPVIGDGVDFCENTYLVSVASETSSKKIKIECELELVEKTDGAYEDNLPRSTLHLNNYKGYKDLALNIDILKLWAEAKQQCSTDACTITVSRERNDFSCNIPNEINVTFGSKFFSSARPLGFLHDMTKVNRLLRVVTDLIAERNLADSHWLRVGGGANEAQRSRGDWKAWRHDIDYEFHLHYWKNGKAIQLANVVVHNDFHID